jgi:hypothetical protein
VISSASADNCTEGLVRALKSEYGNIESGTIDDVLYEVACHESQRTKGTKVGVIVPDKGTFEFGSNEGSVGKACLKKDKRYFSNYSRELSYSFLPKEAFPLLSEMCSERVNLSAVVRGDVVSLRTFYRTDSATRPQ